MTRDKDFKRRIRTRMEKTGEAYTAARAQLLARQPQGSEPAPGAAPVPSVETSLDTSLAGIGEEAVTARTGRGWAEWVEILDGLGAQSRPHREVAAQLAADFGLSPWWAQMVTVGYERIRGLRHVGQRRSGSYEATKSKTLPVAVGRLYRAFTDPSDPERWLPGVRFTVRTATPERSLRLTWEDGTSVEVGFTAKGESKSQVAVQHTRLVSKEDAEARKGYWAERLAALGELLAAEAASGTG